MVQAGVLGQIETFHTGTHGAYFDLGDEFGHYESHQRNMLYDDNQVLEDSKAYLDNINESLSTLRLNLTLRPAKFGKRKGDVKIKNDFGNMQRVLSNETRSNRVYFLLGTVTAMLLYPDPSGHITSLAEARVDSINTDHADLNINTASLFKLISDEILPTDRGTRQLAVNRVLRLLQRLRGKVTILYVTADPAEEVPRHIRKEQEHRDLSIALERGKYGEAFNVEWSSSSRLTDLYNSIIRHEPHIIHFAGHAGAGGLSFEDDVGRRQSITPGQLASMMGNAVQTRRLGVVVLNACYTAEQCDSISDHVGYVVSMGGTVDDKAAILFADFFYASLGHGTSVPDAFNDAKSAVATRYSDFNPSLSGTSMTKPVTISEQSKVRSLEAPGRQKPPAATLLLPEPPQYSQKVTDAPAMLERSSIVNTIPSHTSFRQSVGTDLDHDLRDLAINEQISKRDSPSQFHGGNETGGIASSNERRSIFREGGQHEETERKVASSDKENDVGVQRPTRESNPATERQQLTGQPPNIEYFLTSRGKK